MARKKYTEDDSENVKQLHHMGSNNGSSHHHLQDSTNLKLGQFQQQSQQQQKIKLNNSKSNVQAHSNKGNKYKNNNTSSSKINSEESFFAVVHQLSSTGLTIREMPGDGNCLFRALADQLEGHPRNHLEHRHAVVDFMRKHRPDFEPFVEDDEPFEKYVQSLSQPGTFAGNDAIAAFARLHNVTVVIHQLNSPAWLIHPSNEETHSSNGREVHIAYHNGDHYNSVRKLGDDSDAPANIKLSLQEEGHSGCTNKGIKPGNTGRNSPPRSSGKPQSTGESTAVKTDFKPNQDIPFDSLLYGHRDEDFWVKDTSDVERLVEDVMLQTDCADPIFVRETLIEFHFDITSTVNFIVSMNFLMSQSEEEQQQRLVEEQQTTEPQELDGCRTSETSKESNDKMSSVIDNYEGNSNFTGDAVVPPASDSSDTVVDTNTIEIASISTNSGTALEKQEETCSQLPSQIQENIGNSQGYKVNNKMSARQKKDLKKKERKRESDLRKSRPNENRPLPAATTILPSKLGSLNI